MTRGIQIAREIRQHLTLYLSVFVITFGVTLMGLVLPQTQAQAQPQPQPSPDPDVVAAAAAAAAAVLKTAESTRSGWSDPLVIGMIGGQMILVIGAVASAIVMVLNRATVRNLQEQSHLNSATIMTVRADTEAIKGHVNSEKTAAEGREIVLRQENVLLREMLTEKKMTAQLLAQAAATRVRTPSPAPTMPVTPMPVEVVNQPLTVITPAAPDDDDDDHDDDHDDDDDDGHSTPQ